MHPDVAQYLNFFLGNYGYSRLKYLPTVEASTFYVEFPLIP